MYFTRIQFLSYFSKQTSGEIPVVFDFKFLIYEKKKKNIGHEHLFFSNHLKSTKIKQSFFGKHQKLNTHILTENRQNIQTLLVDETGEPRQNHRSAELPYDHDYDSSHLNYIVMVK